MLMDLIYICVYRVKAFQELFEFIVFNKHSIPRSIPQLLILIRGVPKKHTGQ